MELFLSDQALVIPIVQCVNIPIIDDNVPENTEAFGVISFLSDPVAELTLAPSEAIIFIMDDDRECRMDDSWTAATTDALLASCFLTVPASYISTCI